MGLEHIESWTGKLVGHAPDANENGAAAAVAGESLSNMFEPGDVLFGKLRPYLAKVWVAEFPGRCTTELLVMQPVEVNAQFLRYVCLCRDFIDAVDASTFGSKMPRADWDFIGNIKIPVPALSRQRAIAGYVNRETARLDDLVATKERLLELLAEKRRALITHAVTRGLEPHSPLRDSGVSWLGAIPTHWDVVPLMRITQSERPIMYGIVLPGPDVEEGIPILKGGNVRPARMNLASLARTTPEIEAPYARARLRAGDLVYSIRGSIGDCEVVPSELEGCNITQDVARVAPNADVNADWLRYTLISEPVRQALESGSLGAAVRGINIFDLKRARIPVPPHTEQTLIVDRLREALEGLDMLRHETEHTISLLKERRAALIAKAVSGQIEMDAAA